MRAAGVAGLEKAAAEAAVAITRAAVNLMVGALDWTDGRQIWPATDDSITRACRAGPHNLINWKISNVMSAICLILRIGCLDY